MPLDAPYPVFFHLRHRPVLIVGGGGVALRKATGLVPTGARITIVAPGIDAELASLPQVTVRQEPYTTAMMTQSPRWALAFAATSVRAVNEAVQRDAAAAGVPCCRCDAPDAGDFAGGAMWQAGGVSLVVSTTGASPVLAARIRDQAAGAIDPVLPAFAELLSRWRPRVLAMVADEPARRAMLRRIASSEMESHLRTHGADAADQLFTRWLDDITRTV